MDKSVQFVDDIKPMSENRLLRVRGVEGVAWAVKLYKSVDRAKLGDGNFQQVILLGLDYDNKDSSGRVVGGAAAFGLFFETFVKSTPPAFYFGWQILVISAVAVAVIITLSAAMSLKKVLFLEAGVVFR